MPSLSTDTSTRATNRPWQFTLRGILAVMLAVSFVLAAWRIYGRGVGWSELLLVSMITVSVLVGSLLGWPWSLGIVGCLIFALLFTPADPISTMVVAVPLSCVYTVVVVVWKVLSKRRSPASREPHV